MKILLFTDSLGSGGAQRQLIGLALMLKEQKYVVKVCTYYNFDFYKSYLDKHKIVNELIQGANNVKTRIWSVKKFLKKENPDWVIAYQETPSLVACIAKVLGCKCRLIVSERNTTQSIGKNEKIRFFLYRWADVIVPNSYAQERFLVEHYPWMQNKLKTISNFVDLNRFVFTEKKGRGIPVIMIAATIWPSKNTLGFIEAVKLLVENQIVFRVEWYGVVADYEEYFRQCNDLITQYGIQKYITLFPKTKQIQEKYRDCDFFCLPSFYEGTPNVICEAMACGRPVLCSDVCDNQIYVKEGENGFLFNPKKPKDIASQIERALSLSETEYKVMCQRSREKAVLLLSEEAFLAKYIEILNK